MPSLRMSIGLALLGARLAAPGRRARARRELDVAARLAAFPRAGLPLRAPAEIRWDDRQIPFIEAASERDLAVCLGLVHAHLRLAQIEMMRRVALGRVAEAVGPAGLDIDVALRTLGLARPVPAILAAMDPGAREWLDGFADGLNAYIAQLREPPEEFVRLGLGAAPWTVEDLIALGRLAATDFSWRVWQRLLRLRGRPDWLTIWQRLTRDGAAPVPSFAGAPVDALTALARGSNSCAVAAHRSATGAALIASDPHLSVTLPNLWLIAGMRSPGTHAVGLMIPGVPVVALGRNRWIGWGGTSLHAASSDLFDVTGMPAGEIEERTETIRVRWWPPRTIRVRETRYGPIISDAPLLKTPPRRNLALLWVGHRPNDEIGAMLAVMRARDWSGFLDAIDRFAVPAQNMIYADAEGRVGQAMAAHLPRRPHGAPPDLILDRAAARHWDAFASAKDLPWRLDPPQGFVASANNRPEAAPVPVGYFFSADERVTRLRQMLAAGAIAPARLRAMQRDVAMPSAPALRDRLLAIAAELPDAAAAAAEAALAPLRAWDGRHDADSAGALAFEMLIAHFLMRLHGPEDLAIYTASWDPWALLREDLAAAAPERLRTAMAAALPDAAAAVRRFGTWGEAHRLRLSHPFGALPRIGRRYRFVDLPAAGGNETLMKTAHGFAAGRHAVRLGANARHISDFADPDANWFVLLGGQDGWIGSTTFLDQVALWRRGEYVQVPLRPETVRATFPHLTALAPAVPAAGRAAAD